MSSSDRTSSWRTANQGSNSTHASTNNSNQRPSPAPPLSQSFYNNSNNPLVTGKQPVARKCVLRPLAVRERSKAIQGLKELKNKDLTSTTVSFLILSSSDGDESKTHEPGKLPVRVNVYCDTGTIGTAKIVGGIVRQTFRRNVTSLDVLERLLRNPEGPVEINDQLIGVTDTDEDEETKIDGSSPDFQKGVELADVGLCILEGEREKLAKHLRHIDDETEREAAEAKAAAQKAEKIKQQQKQQQEQQQQTKQEAAKQKQQLPPKPNGAPKDEHSGDLQASMLTKAMGNSSSQKGSGSRIGRRRNKLNNLRKNRNAKKGILPNSTHEMNRTKRRGGKQAAASTTTPTPAKSDRSSSNNKKQSRTGRLAEKITNSITKTAGRSVSSHASSNNDTNDSGSIASITASSEYNKKAVTANTNNTNNVNINSFKHCGYEFHFKLPAEVMNQVDQCLRDIAKMNKVVKGVATNGRGTVFLYGNGGVAYTPAIPKALYQKLRQLRSSSFSSRPCFVALGTRDRYFVSFNDGTGDWKGSSSLDKVLKKRMLKNPTGGSSSGLSTKRSSMGGDTVNTIPRSVAFGSSYDTFFVVFGDGSWEYQGRSIPKSLERKLRERDDAADLVLCNLGPNGEWFMKVESGKMWWSGISPELDQVLKRITKKGYLHNMDFGENGSYFVSYDEE